MTQCPVADPDAPHVDNVRVPRPEIACGREQILCDSPASAVDVDGDVLAEVVDLDLSADVALVNRLSQSGGLLGGSAYSHGKSPAMRIAPPANPIQRRSDAWLPWLRFARRWSFRRNEEPHTWMGPGDTGAIGEVACLMV